MKKIKRVVCVAAAACVLLISGVAAAPSQTLYSPPAQVGITEDTDEQYVAKYEKIEENDHLIFYADLEKGWLALQNRDSGTIWYSTPNDSETDEITTGSRRLDVRSDIIVEYFDKNKVGEAVSMSFNSHTQAVRQGSVQTTRISSGIRVHYSFEAFGMVIPVEYVLTEKCLEARICVEEIQENSSFAILSIRLLPNFGAGDTGTDGWMLIPDGSGAIAKFNNDRYTVAGYEAPVYGSDYANEQELRQPANTQAVRLPVYGIGKSGDALFAVIARGESAAALQAEFSSESFGYNTLSSKVVLRSLSNIEINNTKDTRLSVNGYSQPDYAVRFYCLSGEEANYVGMAKTYRQYLIEEKGLKKTELEPTLNINLYGAVDVKANFLGFPYQKLKSLTSFSQAEAMADYLNASGAGTLSMRYEGWTNGGVFNKTVPKDAKPLRILGGEAGFQTLKNAMEKDGRQFWPDVDFLRCRESGKGISKSRDSIKNAFGEPTPQYDYMLSVYAPKLQGNQYRFLRADAVRKISRNFLENYKKEECQYLSLGTTGEYRYSDYNPDNGHGRMTLQMAFEDIWKTATGYRLAVSGGNADAAIRADKVWAAPVTSSGYDFFDEDIPFYQIVFHGYTALTTPAVNQIVNDRLLFLNAVETGSELLFSGIYEDAAFLGETAYSALYSTTFELWKDEAVAYDKEYRPLLERIGRQAITQHERLADDVYRTTYEDGTSVYVNYSEKQQKVDNVTIGGMDFEAIYP